MSTGSSRINPRTSAKFREAFYSSGAKDDPLDAGLMLDILAKLQHSKRQLVVDEKGVRWS